jgi:hypothetical protein
MLNCDLERGLESTMVLEVVIMGAYGYDTSVSVPILSTLLGI